MKLHFSSIFDSNYLSRGLNLYNSIKKYHKEFTLFVIALDEKAEQYFKVNRHENIICFSIKDIETFFPELAIIKNERDFVSYLFTLSPYYPLFLLKKFPALPHICSLDADQQFFSNSETIFNELKSSSILITPHRFTPELLKTGIQKYGTYNVSFQVFKNDITGLSCLELWRKQCYEWCKDTWEDDKFADQKYLETWSNNFPNKVKEITHPGLGLAPWNINNYKILSKKGELTVDGNNLILFHYQGLRILNNLFIYTAFDEYLAKTSKIISNKLLKPIIQNILKNQGYKNDSISRNSANLDITKISQNKIDSYYKVLFRKPITLKQYLKVKSLIPFYN